VGKSLDQLAASLVMALEEMKYKTIAELQEALGETLDTLKSLWALESGKEMTDAEESKLTAAARKKLITERNEVAAKRTRANKKEFKLKTRQELTFFGYRETLVKVGGVKVKRGSSSFCPGCSFTT
jgi:hypothetical protein